MSITSPRLLLNLCVLSNLSCQEINPEFCTDHPGDVACPVTGDGVGSGIDAPNCTSDAECASPTPVCDTTRSMCVQCLASAPSASSSCDGTTPACGDDGTCRGCTMDSECESMTCLPDGSCAAAGNVLYVAVNGSDTGYCTPMEKCALSRAIALLDGTKSTIRLDPGFYTATGSQETFIFDTSMRIVGRGAVFGRPVGSLGDVLVIRAGDGSPSVELDYVEVRGGSSGYAPAGTGVVCEKAKLTLREVSIDTNPLAGLSSFNCTLTITHSRITQNHGYGLSLANGDITILRSVISKNPLGGLALTGTVGAMMKFDLENNFIVQNGLLYSEFGGVLFDRISPPGPHVFAFNTVAFNAADTSAPAPGVICQPTAGMTPMFANNIVFNNSFTNATTTQIAGDQCSWVYSDIGPVSRVPVVGGNLVFDPMFVDTLHADPRELGALRLSGGDFHLKDTSPVRNAADPAATTAVDIDGEARPQGSGREMGADEIK